MASTKRPRIGSERGVALLETAFTIPLLLLVAVAIFEFGRAFETWQVMTNAAREGARVAVLPNPGSGAVDARVREYLEVGALENVDSVSVAIDRNVSIDIGGTTASASRVTVTYPFSFMVLNPVANLVVNGSTLGHPLTLTTSALMRNESQF